MKYLFTAILASFLIIQANGTIIVPQVNSQHPHIFMTGSELDLMKQRVADLEQPWYDAWLNVQTRAEAEMSIQANPYTGLDASIFYDRCSVQSERALNLAIAYQINPKRQYALAALNALYQWALQTTSTVPEIYTYSDTGIYNINTSMLIARSTIQFIFVYDLMYNHFAATNFNEDMQQVVRNWFSLLAVRMEQGIWIWHNNDYFNKQEYQNHLVAHKMGLIAVGYALKDRELLQFAIDSDDNPRDLVELIEGCIFMQGDEPCHREPDDAPPVQTGEIYDRYRHYTAPLKGLQYSHLTLTLLTVCANMTANNGLDFFAYTSPTGENLELAFDFYSSFYWLQDARLRGGMYGDENDRLGLAGDTRAVFELGYSRYPDNKKIAAVLQESDRTDFTDSRSDGRLWLMGAPVLTHGSALPPKPQPKSLGNWDMETTTITTQEGKQKLSLPDSEGRRCYIIPGRTEQYGGDNPDLMPQITGDSGSKALSFDGNDSAYIPDLWREYDDIFIDFVFSPADVSTDQTIISLTSCFEVRLVAGDGAAALQFILYDGQGGHDIASSAYSITAGNAYQVQAWVHNHIAAIYVDGQTDIFAYMPQNALPYEDNLYLATIYKFDRRFFSGSISELSIYYNGELICGDWGFAVGDVNKDCYVDIYDFAMLARYWLDCTNELIEDCYRAN